MIDPWQELVQRYVLSDVQLKLFRTYVGLLQEVSAHYNLTALYAERDIIEYHLADSLELGMFCDMKVVTSLVDVGTGAGLPGLMLKIKYPHLSVVLLEVLGKRRMFLERAVRELGLTDVEISGMDWRTWLRSKSVRGDIVCARASLQPCELLRMFQPGSSLKHARLVYWASAQWRAQSIGEAEHLVCTHSYTVGDRARVLVEFGAQKLRG